jgi:hypothetical protein
MLADQSSFFSTASHKSLSNIMDSMGPERHYRPGLVVTHEPAVPDDIRSKNGSEAALQGQSPSDGRLAEDQVRIHVWQEALNDRLWL